MSCKKAKKATSLMKFSGESISDTPSVTSIADPGIETLGQAGSNEYPVAEPFFVSSLAANVLSSIPSGSTVRVALFKNGTQVADVSFAFFDPTQKRKTFSEIPFSFPDTFDLRIIATGATKSYEVSATIGYRTRNG